MGTLAGGVLVAGLLTGVALPTAVAQPAEPTVETEAPEPQAEGPPTPCTGEDCNKDDEAAPKVNADQVLSLIHEEYRQGDGGGQISKLIDDAVKLRQQGYRPSNANAAALADALEHRPNQTPLVEALKETIAYQRKLQARAAQAVVDNGPVAGPVPVIPGMTAPAG
ncbi:hypothetical protein AU186_03870 [Mycobacterium sp. GA-1999]|nr:hypothetical protein AU186_03870 [Mycobacterium sp. GA-1999]KUH90992.1 hypothetical protein AU185_04560 [Mycobacterium sp. GA-0227b]KUH91256.1 hypothetical protein AU187_16935 [Mycobacterium sp. IS-1556]